MRPEGGPSKVSPQLPSARTLFTENRTTCQIKKQLKKIQHPNVRSSAPHHPSRLAASSGPGACVVKQVAKCWDCREQPFTVSFWTLACHCQTPPPPGDVPPAADRLAPGEALAPVWPRSSAERRGAPPAERLGNESLRPPHQLGGRPPDSAHRPPINRRQGGSGSGRAAGRQLKDTRPSGVPPVESGERRLRLPTSAAGRRPAV